MRYWILLIILLLELILFAPLNGVTFSSWSEFSFSFGWFCSAIFEQSVPLLILSVGMTFILMTGGIDLSIGSMVALIACVMSLTESPEAFWYTGFLIGLVLALGLGLFNGFLISRMDVPPIITTLGTLIFYRGLCTITVKQSENAIFGEIPHYEIFRNMQTLLALVVMICLGGAYAYYRSRWRRDLLMIGGNPIAARYAGIPVGWRLVQVYTLMGFFAFIAALCLTSWNGSVSASSFQGLELKVIVAVVLGGTRVEGGRGSIICSLIGVLMIAVLEEGLRGAGTTFENIDHLRYVLLGLLLIGGVWLNKRNEPT
ncbi:Ribose transport system permease protein RbsC [Polystyrenella longa]|uniref:Ribose transport system permease protein RbsC n=1 Tax=Polystyrenella longa TaxID=2528007 RepID=A0A518CI90_9PLAN|nr:ABC transporter permease [Polystyrenella longa]QDU78935.1 Ribose transport system permease protein RbsC [Polystyrenella longa]